VVVMDNKTKIKICGLTRAEDIENVNKLLPDYIGFVFWEKSKRNVSKEKAAELKALLAPGIKAVGVFVDADPEFVADLVKDGIIDIAQLHGTEDASYIERLRECVNIRLQEKVGSSRDKADTTPEFEIIKAFNVNKLDSFEEAEKSPADYIMMDSGKGSGVTFDWSKLDGLERPYFLAGGLSPDNVKEVTEKLHPFGVDVSSGVETDGVKDAAKMIRFMNALC